MPALTADTSIQWRMLAATRHFVPTSGAGRSAGNKLNKSFSRSFEDTGGTEPSDNVASLEDDWRSGEVPRSSCEITRSTELEQGSQTWRAARDPLLSPKGYLRGPSSPVAQVHGPPSPVAQVRASFNNHAVAALNTLRGPSFVASLTAENLLEVCVPVSQTSLTSVCLSP